MSSRSSDKTIVLKIGGSYLLNKDGQPDVSSLRDMADTVKEILQLDATRKLVVVVGGGVAARTYISVANALGSNLATQDRLGILASRMNAFTFVLALQQAGLDRNVVFQGTPVSDQEVEAALGTHRVVVLGGLQPGQSTTAVAALCAEYCDAQRVIFATNVDGVYTANPATDKTARKLVRVSYSQLEVLCGGDNNIGPGQYQIMDKVALGFLKRSPKIESVVLKGDKKDILAAVTRDFSKVDEHSADTGTIICDRSVELHK